MKKYLIAGGICFLIIVGLVISVQKYKSKSADVVESVVGVEVSERGTFEETQTNYTGATTTFSSSTFKGVATFQQGFISNTSSTVATLNFGKAIFSTPVTAVAGNYEILRNGTTLIINSSSGTIDLRIAGNAIQTFNANGTATTASTTQGENSLGVTLDQGSLVVGSVGNITTDLIGRSMTASHATGAHTLSGRLIGTEGIAAETVAGAITTEGYGLAGRLSVDAGTITGAAVVGQIVSTGGTMPSSSAFYAKATNNTGGTQTRTYGYLSGLTESGANNWAFYDGSGNVNTHSYFANAQVGTSTFAGNPASLLVQASSTTAVPLLLRDNNGNAIFQTASTSVAILQDAVTPLTLNDAAAITLGNTSNLDGMIDLKRAGTSGGPVLILRRNTGNEIAVELGGGTSPFIIVANGTASTTLTHNALTFGRSTNNNGGVISFSSAGNVSASGTLQIYGAATLSASSTLGSGTATTTIKSLVANGGVVVSNLGAAPAGSNPICLDGAFNAYIGSSSICPLSTLDNKENLKPISYGLKEILKTEFYDFQLKNSKDGRIHSGPIADYTNEYMPNLTEWRNGEKNGFDYLSMVGVEGQAIKDLHAIVVEQQKQINELKAMVVAQAEPKWCLK